jgi:hypothetical protein
MDLQKDELWLMTKDSQTKKIKSHIKFDITDYVQSNINDVYNYVGYAIDYACKHIDDKHFSMLKKSMEYNLAGIKEYKNNVISDASQLKYMLYSFENNLSEMIEYVNKSLDYGGVDLGQIYPFILGIFQSRKITSDFLNVEYHTEQQQILIDLDIINIVEKFNSKIKWQTENIWQQVNIQNWSLPPWFAMANSINAQEYINKIERLRISNKEQSDIL